MRILIAITRILLFACSLVCLTIDTAYVVQVGLNSSSYSYSSHSSYYGYDYAYNNYLSRYNNLKSTLAFSMFNDLISLLIGGYYIVMIENNWNKKPKIFDYIICGVELILWSIYAGLQFTYSELIINPIYSVIIIVLYIICSALLYVLNKRIQQFGESSLTPIGRRDNDPGVGTNNAMNSTNNGAP